MSANNQERKDLFGVLNREALEQYGLEMVHRDYPGMDIDQLSEQVGVRRFHDWMTRSLDLVDHVGSEIEQVFMSSMIVRAMGAKAFAVEFRSSSEDIERVEYLIQLMKNLNSSHDLEIDGILEDAHNMPELYRAEFLHGFGDYHSFEEFVARQVSEGRLSEQDRCDAYDRFPFYVYDHHVFCFVQPTIYCGDIPYRPDFLMWMPNAPHVRMVVECDGRDFHISPETFTRDRVRDRNLVLNDYDVLRYSGAEIYSDPSAATENLCLHFLKKLTKLKI
ncbi:hypothetical protein ELH67_08515 [Rhizobium ruizarguesonis]|uniref:hypothetical protein n=1 Tax=Rhizobium ruizarguesonis TaxID=2081791 RepID=UPI00103170C2|nr:hypothetical protein [Rhizobium ruizarguesonis]TAZ94590.1 hypothetical protein ELH67_08515 [Rhizobium ruizarguesonis]